jgi:hypothetical protein
MPQKIFLATKIAFLTLTHVNELSISLKKHCNIISVTLITTNKNGCFIISPSPDSRENPLFCGLSPK